jgi:hypothetical protein
MGTLEPALVVKYGGSSLDLELDESKQKLLPMIKAGPVLRNLAERYSVVVMPGGGPTNDLLKAVKRNYADQLASAGEATMNRLLKDVLTVNAHLLAMVWGDDSLVESLPDPESSSQNSLDALREKLLRPGLHILPFAPKELVDMDALLSYKNSDTLTLAVANWLGARTVLFLKDADGIFSFDQKWPLPEFKKQRHFFEVGYLSSTEQPKDPVMPHPERLVEPPDFRESLTAAEMLDTVWRVSPVDGQKDHLIEDDALRYLKKTSGATVEKVVIGQVLQSAAIVNDLAREVTNPGVNTKYSVLRPR